MFYLFLFSDLIFLLNFFLLSIIWKVSFNFQLAIDNTVYIISVDKFGNASI